MCFLYCIILKSNGLSWTLNGSFTEVWICNIGHLKKIIIPWVMQTFQMLTHFITQYKKLHSLILPLISSESNESHHQGVDKSFQNFTFSLESRFLSAATNAVSGFFLDVTGLLHSALRPMSAKHRIPQVEHITCCCPLRLRLPRADPPSLSLFWWPGQFWEFGLSIL